MFRQRVAVGLFTLGHQHGFYEISLQNLDIHKKTSEPREHKEPKE